ncbi:MAG: hypothetical protein AB7J13_05455 [Pyrinomonadaceae bacterium]
MAKELINENGQDRIVRADTAKAFRGVKWALWSVLAFVVITATLFIIFSLTAVSDGDVSSPAEIQRSGGQ